MSKVLVSVPSQGWMRIEVAKTMVNLAQDSRHTVHFFMPQQKPTEHAMSLVINQFCDSEFEYDFWLNIDDDNPPWKNPLDLCELDLDIVACPTPIWSYGWNGSQNAKTAIHWNCYDYQPEQDNFTPHHTPKGLQEIDGFGFGCFLMHRRVFDFPGMRHAPCMRTWKEDGTVYRGLDLAFSRKFKEAGGKIHAHYDYPCSHIKEVDLTQFIHVTNQITKRADPAPGYKAPRKFKRQKEKSGAV